jgi:prevent-host-death family protein
LVGWEFKGVGSAIALEVGNLEVWEVRSLLRVGNLGVWGGCDRSTSLICRITYLILINSSLNFSVNKMKLANLEEAENNLPQLIEYALQGEEVIISQAGKPLVKLVRYSPVATPRTPGFWEGKVKMSDDFDVTPNGIINAFMGEE